MDELKPAAGHTAAGVYTGDEQWPTSAFRKGGDILDPVVVSNAMMKLAGEGAGSKAYPGIHAGSSEVGSEGKDSGASKVPPPPPKPRTAAKRKGAPQPMRPRAAVTRARWEAQA